VEAMEVKMKLICWDYNDTIVGRINELRPHMAEVLTALRADGYANVVTTTIGKSHVEGGLKKLGIDGLVDDVFGDRRNSRDSKDYKDVLKAMKIPEDRASESVVVIGDKDHDHPGDLEKVVFIYNPKGYETDAKVVQKLLAEMHQKGDNNFYRGFNRFKTADIDLEQEAGYVYHGQLMLPNKHKGVLLSTFNGNPWVTPTVLLIPASEAAEFEQFER
jgi:hydroxymethylpyrimidine pyrophosphatase-like HAD family hydrolase